MYLTDLGGHEIRKLNTTDTLLSTFAGDRVTSGFVDGLGTNARFKSPNGVAVDSNRNIYVADYSNSAIRKITTGAEVTTFYSDSTLLGLVKGVAVDSSANVYATGNQQCSVVSFSPAGTLLRTIGGQGCGASIDGVGTNANFRFPFSLAVSTSGIVYVGDYAAIREIDTAGAVTTYAGTKNSLGSADGPVASALFNFIMGVSIDTGGALFVVDQNNVIRTISTAGLVTTIAGQSGSSGLVNGFGTSTKFSDPIYVAVSTSTTLYVTDESNLVIRSMALGGYCSAGKYASTPSTTSCTMAPAGYYKPLAAYSDNYYVFGPGTYSVSGSSSCTSCSSSSSYGATYCPPTTAPTPSPTPSPTRNPTTSPTAQPTTQPTFTPTADPTTSPTDEPSVEASPSPTSEPSAEPSPFPTSEPSSEPSSSPTSMPTITRTEIPTTSRPTAVPSSELTYVPTKAPTAKPSRTAAPTVNRDPSTAPTLLPTPVFGFLGFDYGKSSALTLDDMNCFTDNGLAFFLPRGFATWNSTTRGVESVVDPHICRHLELAATADLTVKGIYIQARNRFGLQHETPILSLKAHLLKRCSEHVDTPVWLVISTAGAFVDNNNGWLDSTQHNRRWFEKLVKTCKQYFKSCGVMSNKAAWTTVFGASYVPSTSVIKNVPVWYSVDSSSPKFADFGTYKFGGWNHASLKQYETSVQLCGHAVGLDYMSD